MSFSRRSSVNPRNGHTLVVGIPARISGGPNQKEASLDDQIAHMKEVIEENYEGSIEYRPIATTNKGERLDRPELEKIKEMLRSGELDILAMEDVGRLVRGAEAVRLWGMAVDHGTRCIAPNDGCDTADDNWEEDLLSACRDHVVHNVHHSKRLKFKLMNRFKLGQGATGLPIAGYEKPNDAETYDDWRKLDEWTPTIRQGLKILQQTLNCSAVADYFNEVGFLPGPYCKNKKWDGKMVRRYYNNRLLAGHPGRGHMESVKHHETGRRVSKKKNGEPIYLDIPHLAHVDACELDETRQRLTVANKDRGRPKVNGSDPLNRRPKKRTRFPGQHARCWYCGQQAVWGSNGGARNLTCAGSRNWQCWNGTGFTGAFATRQVVDRILSELHKVEQFEEQFALILEQAHRDRNGGVTRRREELERAEAALARKKKNLLDFIQDHGSHPDIEGRLLEIHQEDSRIRQELRTLELLKQGELWFPKSATELRTQLTLQLHELAAESFEAAELLKQIVPQFDYYAVRLLDGGHPMPRARVVLDLSGSIDHAAHVPGLQDLLTSVHTIDLFERPPQRERIREEAVALRTQGLLLRQIVARLEERPKMPAIQRALTLDQMMRERGAETPYMVLEGPPDDYTKQRRHKHRRYRFEPLEGYERTPL